MGDLMRRLLIVLAALLGLAGLVWVLQGINILPGSFMSGDLVWTYRGAGVMAVGAAVAVAAARWRRRGGPADRS